MILLTTRPKKEITFISGGLLLLAFGLHLIGYSSSREAVLIASTLIAAVPIGGKALQAVRMKTFSIELLVMLAVIGALVIGEFVESAVVTFLFLFGDYLEGRTLAKTRSALKKLTDLAPQEAVIVQGGSQLTVPVDEVEEGQRVVIRTGSKVPVDGRILTGQAILNEAAITGESVPVTKEVGEGVFSGSIVDTGYIEIEAEKVGDDTTFTKIIELVEEAQESKSPTEKFLDRFAQIYTPAVVVLAVLVYLVTRDVHLSITFLVIACPGALVIGAPVSSVAGIGNGAGRGVLIKGGEVMDRLAKVDTLVFDKTGTLTKGKPEVTEIRTFGGVEKLELLRLVAEVETVSEHHLGQTIVKEAEARWMRLNRKPGRTEVMKGSGIRAEVEGQTIVAGN
ncbi:hypothetical protein B0X71_10650 [Planococcus lenghuensis]|uniref:Cd(2+)-exporting ATPase n=1 Tax=Planococcus lenghuensis TaxID=2213202 RepID=A0A1Q2KZB6_9BACL|nr:hypothetical protein B0X71_10650 [Planococcus lenghuensis]